MPVQHAYQSPTADNPGSEISSGEWNAAHDIVGGLLIPAETLSAPAAGKATITARTGAGRTVPAFISQDGVVRDIQTALSTRSPWSLKAIAGATTFTAVGALSGPIAVGTATAAVIAQTSRFTEYPKVEYLVTTAATTAVAGFRYTNAMVSVGGVAAGRGGFNFVGQWGPATGVATTTMRAAFGLFNATAASTDVEPSTLVSGIWMGWDAADSNVQIMSNDATGAATKVDLGASFPVPTADRAALYQLELSSPPGTTRSVDWTVTDLVSGATANGTITVGTDLPASTALLAPKGYCSVGGTSSVVGFGLVSLYLDPLL